jgi:hypothetical protein
MWIIPEVAAVCQSFVGRSEPVFENRRCETIGGSKNPPEIQLLAKLAQVMVGLLRHANVTTTLDLYSQSIDAAKLEAQEDIALAIKSAVAAD